MVSTPEFNGGKQGSVKVPRIAVTFVWLGLIAYGVGLNMARYPLVSQMGAQLVPTATAGTACAAGIKQRAAGINKRAAGFIPAGPPALRPASIRPLTRPRLRRRCFQWQSPARRRNLPIRPIWATT